MPTGFMIGLTQNTMTDLEDLGLLEPFWTFARHSASAITASGKTVELGYANTTWRWAYIPESTWNNFFGFVNRDIYIRTKADDGQFHVFRAIMAIPEQPMRHEYRHKLEVEVRFNLLERIT